MARVLLDAPMNHVRRSFNKGEALERDAAFRLAWRVTKHSATTSGVGVRCNMSSNKHE